MTEHINLYLFGDQTFNSINQLTNLLQARDNLVLDSLLTKAYNALRTQIHELPPETRKSIPRFCTIEDLVNARKFGEPCIPLDMALTCLYHLSKFVVCADEVEYMTGKGCTLGLCTGTLAAAAVSCSLSTLDLISPAIDAIIVAFRIGLLVENCAAHITQADPNEKSWSVVCSTPRAVEVLHQFCAETTLPIYAKPYVSAYSPSSITISGPPRSLELLVTSKAFSGMRYEFLPIHGPYHAPHLYSEEDVEHTLKHVTSREAVVRHSRLPAVSSVDTGLRDEDLATLLRAAVTDILRHPVRWDGILEGLGACSRLLSSESFDILSIGSTAERVLRNTLSQASLSTTHPRRKDQTRTPGLDFNNGSETKRPKLAIIAMSGRFPGANSNDEFWDLLYQGLDVHKPVPALHWDAHTHVDATGNRKNTSATSFGCWLENPAEFDAPFFNISPREAPQIDPAQRLALMTAYEAIEQAGLVPDATPSTKRDRVGVFYGVTSNDWMETNSAQNIDTYFIPGGNRAFIPGRINYCFKFSGPSYAVDTACSSSLAGIHLACNALWQGDIDTAIAGGTNVLTNPDFTAGLDRGHFLSREGNCKTFDDTADGYCRGEGIGTIIIKRLEDAMAESDPILGVISGACTNHSAESNSITRPHEGAQRAVFERLLSQSAVSPYEVGYVEMHGTGTQAGDAGEMASVLSVFAPPLSSEIKKLRKNDEALYLGSAKANIGHGEAASGVSSLIKVLLMMQHSIIVPHCGIKTRINRRFPTDLEERNVRIAKQPTPWPRIGTQSRKVFVNNFSAAGGNTALLIEDAPLRPDKTEAADPRSLHLIAVSAKAATSLQGNLRSLLEFLQVNQDISIGQLSYTTTARRIHHQFRAMIIGKDVGELCKGIEKVLEDKTGTTRRKMASKVVFTFTGQGAQYSGMGKDFFEHFPTFRAEILHLDYIGRGLGFPSIVPVIQSEKENIEAHSPTAVQLASVCMQLALSKLWATWNITPVAVLGHSLGEYAALSVAGVLSEAETIYAVGTRAELLQAMCTKDTHSMLVVRASLGAIEKVLEGRDYEISCINSPIETVLSGSKDGMASTKELLQNAGVKSTLLRVPYAFHSSQVERIMPAFEKKMRGITFSKPRIPILRPLDGRADQEAIYDSRYLAAHAREPVNMFKTLKTAHELHLITQQTIMVEIGPHPAVSGMVGATLGSEVMCLPSIQRFRSAWHTTTSALSSLYHAGLDINWAAYQREFPGSEKVVALPAYSWSLKDYWIQYVNDWSLRKGDPPLSGTETNLESTTIHRIVEKTASAHGLRLIVEADIARKDLRPLVQGHEVDGIPLCTPSVYADISLTIGAYLLGQGRLSSQSMVVDVSDMLVSKALILHNNESPQLLQAHTDVNWADQTASIRFMSFDKSQKLQEHSRCVIRFKHNSLQQQLQNKSKTTKKQMQALRDGIVLGTTARFNRPMAYRMIRPLARFHDDYRAIDEIILNSDTLEASSRLSFASVKRGGEFHTHPAIIDALTQSCGFAMNCNDSTDLDVQVYMNHGWGNFSLFEPMNFEKVYTTYTRMEQGANKLWHGDVTVFDGDRVVAYFGQIAIQGVPRKVLKAVLSLESGLPSRKPFHHPKTAQIPDFKNVSHETHNGESVASKLSEAVSIIAEASGIATIELTDDTVFADVGIDSLMGLTISACLREQLDLDVDFQSFVFDYPTVGDLKSHLKGVLGFSKDTHTTSSSNSTTAISTPISGEPATPLGIDFQCVLKIVSEESGIAVADLTDDTEFADAGVDSLLSIIVASRLKDELGLSITHDSLFTDCPTVLDLRRMLSDDVSAPIGEARADSIVLDESQMHLTAVQPSTQRTNGKDLLARKELINQYVRKHTAGLSVPVSSSSASQASDQSKVILITGASGSLGANLVNHLAHLPDTESIICLNRKSGEDPLIRQKKAMRDKGIRFPKHLEAKLCVIQTDTAKPMLGLSKTDYENLTGSVTHIIHNAWPMSAKRPLSGFESQFQVLRNLIDFSYQIAARRPETFRLGFQMVSSIGVVGHYGRKNAEARTTVPETHVDIDSVLPNGYSEAKWGCEQMIAITLQQHPHRFRAMIVRLGQIAGSRTSGYWNPMEHFGFLVKSSQTLNALPDVPGLAYWTTVNDVAATLSDLAFVKREHHPIYHVDNPVGQSWKMLNSVIADALNITNLIPFEEWVERVRAAPPRNNPASTLLEFLDDNYIRMSCGGLVLDVKHAIEHSIALSAVGPVTEEVVRKYLNVWREIGFLKA